MLSLYFSRFLKIVETPKLVEQKPEAEILKTEDVPLR